MPIDPQTAEVVTISDLDDIQISGEPTAALRQDIFVGVDDRSSGDQSFRMDLETLRIVLGAEPSETTIINVNNHNQSDPGGIPRPFYIDSMGNARQATTAAVSALPMAYIVSVPDQHHLEIMTSGVLKSPGHGLPTGQRLYLQDNGTLTSIGDDNIEQLAIAVLGPNDLVLFQVREKLKDKEPHIPPVASTASMTELGRQYRLLADETVGSVTFGAGIYFVDYDNSLIRTASL